MRPRWRVVRITLRTLMVLVTALGLWLGWYANRVHQPRRAVAAIRAAGGSVTYSYVLPEDGWDGWGPPYGASPDLPVPLWLMKLAGRDYFTTVVGVQSRSAAALDALLCLPGLVVLDLSYAPVDDADLDVLAGHRRLMLLSLQNTNVSGSCFRTLSHLPLEVIDVSGPKVTDATLDDLARLPHLRCLRIEGCTGITRAGWSKLARLKKLRQLHIRNNDVDDRALAAISTLPMICIYVSGAHITDRGLEYVTRCTHARDISLTSPLVSDAGLGKLGQLQKLKHLGLYGKHVTPTALAEFKRVHPRVTVNGK